MKKCFLRLLSAIALLTAFVSCDDEAEYIAPKGLSIVLTPSQCSAGDTVTAVLHYDTAGANWYWSSNHSMFTVSAGCSFAKIVDGKDKYDYVLGAANSETFCKVVAKEPGEYTITFSGRTELTAGTNEYGGLFGESMSTSAKLNVK